jgi:hypothetical protein
MTGCKNPFSRRKRVFGEGNSCQNLFDRVLLHCQISFDILVANGFIAPASVEPKGKKALTWGNAKRTAHTLLQNYPNPFNPETWIPFELANESDVILRIYDAKGSMVREIPWVEQEKWLPHEREQTHRLLSFLVLSNCYPQALFHDFLFELYAH